MERVGSAAYCHETGGIKKAYLGTMGSSTVYAGEAYGIVQALEMAAESERMCPIYIFADNQSIIQSITNPTAKAAQDFIIRIHQLLNELLCPVQIHWIPAHQGMEGNEVVDVAAKEATGWSEGATAPSEPSQQASIMVNLTAPFKDTLTKGHTAKWNQDWTTGRNGTQHRRIAPSPDEKHLQTYRNVPKPLTSLVTQMRTGKIGLNAYLHRNKVPGFDSPKCDRCEGLEDQTVSHILLSCTAFTGLREEWRQVIQNPTTDLTKILNDPSIVIPTASFLLSTKTLMPFRHVDQEELAADLRTVQPQNSQVVQ